MCLSTCSHKPKTLSAKQKLLEQLKITCFGNYYVAYKQMNRLYQEPFDLGKCKTQSNRFYGEARLFDWQKPVTTGTLPISSSGRYPKGYHVYGNLTQAKKIKSDYCVTRCVLFKAEHLKAVGEQDDKLVLVLSSFKFKYPYNPSR